VQWSTVSGPTTVSFSAPTNLATRATFNRAGTYVLRLTANDGLLSGSGDLTVQVNEASSVSSTVSTSSPIAPTTGNAKNCGAGIGSLLIGIAWAQSFLRRQKT